MPVYAYKGVGAGGRSTRGFVDADNGTVVGDFGTILRTTDGGTTWVQQSSGTRHHLKRVSATDASTATVVGPNGIILRTSDGGGL